MCAYLDIAPCSWGLLCRVVSVGQGDELVPLSSDRRGLPGCDRGGVLRARGERAGGKALAGPWAQSASQTRGERGMLSAARGGDR